LPLSQVEPLAAEVVTHGAQGSRVTPWQGAPSGRPEPEAGKRQRNGASAGFNCGIRRSYRRPRRGKWVLRI
jgi:hypothetical protein